MTLFTLIHVCRNEQSIHNNSFVKNFDAQIALYLNCAKQLHQSLKKEGIDLIILTNKKGALDKLNIDNYQINIIELNFKLKVPSGIKFYSAHFKIEVFEYLTRSPYEYVGLIDADMACINPLPQAFKNIIKDKLPLYYNITDQLIPAYGHDNILIDKAKLSATNPAGIWAGGEFLTGTPAFFKDVYNEVLRFMPLYFSDFADFNHQGDEMLTSVALENMMCTGNKVIIDAGQLGIIARYWSPQTMHVQKNVEAYTDYFFLHLPSDKKFIAGLFGSNSNSETFFKEYKKHLHVSRFVEHSFKGLKPFVKKLQKTFLK